MTNKRLEAAMAELVRNPKSKAIPLKLYIKDHLGFLHNPITDEMRKDLANALAEVKGRNVPAIKEICRDCVGDGADENCAKLIRECEIVGCFLHKVRPYQPKPKAMGFDDGISALNADWKN